MPRCIEFIDRSKEYSSTADEGPFQAHFKVLVVLIIEHPTVTHNCEM